MSTSERTAKILLSLIIAARATSFCFSKFCLATMPPFCILAFRFCIAFFLLAIMFIKQLKNNFQKSDMIKGILFGILYFIVMSFEYRGLQTANTSTASLIENLAIVLVPFFNIPFVQKLPKPKNVLCAILSFIGVALLTYKASGISIGYGEINLFGAAIFYTIAIVVTAKLSQDGNALIMGIYQVGTIGILSLTCSIISHSFTMPSSPMTLVSILILALVCTCFGYTLQPVVQSKLNADDVGVFCAINPSVASIIGFVLLNEQFTEFNLLGLVFIIVSIIISTF